MSNFPYLTADNTHTYGTDIARLSVGDRVKITTLMLVDGQIKRGAVVKGKVKRIMHGVNAIVETDKGRVHFTNWEGVDILHNKKAFAVTLA